MPSYKQGRRHFKWIKHHFTILLLLFHIYLYATFQGSSCSLPTLLYFNLHGRMIVMFWVCTLINKSLHLTITIETTNLVSSMDLIYTFCTFIWTAISCQHYCTSVYAVQSNVLVCILIIKPPHLLGYKTHTTITIGTGDVGS